MNFEKYLDDCWTLHATDSKKVADSFSDGLSLISTSDEMSDMIHLISHVYCEHLGEWQKGIDLLSTLKVHPLNSGIAKNQMQIEKSVRICRLASNQFPEIVDLTQSEQAAIFAGAAKGLGGLLRAEPSKAFLLKALELMEIINDVKSPTNRDLAIAGNQIASAFEEKEHLSEFEKEYMIFAAKIGRKYWELAGTWMNIERAEYRLAKVYLKANEPNKSLQHALTCIEICEANSAPDLEFFFGYEVIADAEKAAKNQSGLEQAIKKMTSHFEKLTEADKNWTEKTLNRFKK